MNLLVVTTCFSPENAVGAIRLTKFVKSFVRNGIKVTVISPTLHEGSKIDISLECEELKQVKRITVSQSLFFDKIFLRKRNNMLQKKSANQYIQGHDRLSRKQRFKVSVFRYLQFMYTLLRNRDWERQVVAYAKSNFEIGQFDAILTSYPSLGAPWASLKLRQSKIANYLVVDFRDPIAYENNTTFLINKIYQFIQKKIIQQSNAITFISSGVGEMLRVGNTSNAYVMTNGFDPDDMCHETIDSNCKDKVLTLCYVGSLYGGARDFSPLFEILKNLDLGGRIKMDQVRLVYAGTEAPVMMRQAQSFGLESIIENRGFVTREESLAIQSQADICLVSSWNSEKDKGIMTGKLFEYFTNRKMVIAIVSGTVPGSEMAEVIRKVNAGVCFEVAAANVDKEKEELMETLAMAFYNKVTYGRLSHNYSREIEEYTFDALSKRFISILQCKPVV